MKPFESLGYRGQVGRLRRLASVALRGYDLDVASLALLVHLENTTFRVVDRDGRQYALRIHRVIGSPFHPPRAVAEVRSEVEWLAAIGRDTGIVVPDPVARRDGGLVTVASVDGVPEPRICVLFRWVDGRIVDRRLTPARMEAVGRFTARLHRHARGFRPSDGFTRRRVDHVTPAMRDWAEAAVTETIGAGTEVVVASTIDRLHDATVAIAQGPEVYGLIHADLHQWNYLFHRGEVRAIDFDDCGWGCFLYDLAVTLSEVRAHSHYEDLRAALLRGYRGELPLPPEHEPLLEAFLAFRDLQLALWFIEQRRHPGFADWETEARELLAGLGAAPSRAT